MFKNTKSDLLDEERNPFGFCCPSMTFILGTKGDVHTFFLVLNDLVKEGILENKYQTISNDLYRTFIGRHNFEDFKEQLPLLKESLSKIKSKNINWSKYPNNKKPGIFDYMKKVFNIKLNYLDSVFSEFLEALDECIFWMEDALPQEKELGYKPRIFVYLTDISETSEARELKDEDFFSASENPLWLRFSEE